MLAHGKQAVAFLKKSDAKKLLLPLHGVLPRPPGAKVFWFFFLKKNRFLP